MDNINFDHDRYKLIQQRIKRQHKIRSQLMTTDKRYQLLTASIKRSETLLEKIRIHFFREVATISKQHHIPASLPHLVADGIVKNNLVAYKLIKDNWSSYYNQYKRLKL